MHESLFRPFGPSLYFRHGRVQRVTGRPRNFDREHTACWGQGWIGAVGLTSASLHTTQLLISFSLLNAKGEAKAVIKAHDGEVNDLALYEPDKQNSYAASCGRDRTIQVFRISNDEYSLQQSLINEHAGPIRKLEFADNGSVLASMSPDRTIVIHRKVLKTDSSIAFVSTKVISLKATPLTMTLLPEAMPALLVSATDRCIHKVSIAEGHVTQTIKTTDNTNAEPGVISRLSVGDLVQQSNKPSVIAGFSLADRSVRLYDVETGSLLVTEFGQTAVSDLALAEAPGPSGEIVTKVISTGLDGTIMIWSISTPSQKSGLRQDAGDGSYQNDPLKILPTSGPRPLRRVLSKIEIAQHQKTLVKLERVAPTASTNLSPSRLHRSTSKFTIADTPEVFDPSQSDKDCYSHAFAFGSFHRKGTKLAHPRLSPKSNTQSRFRRSSLDERHRDIVAHCNRDINTTGQQLLDVLQGFRKELVTSKESLSVNTRQALQRELHSTLENLTQQSRRNDPNDGEIGNESFDDSLARMIDDRLALRFKCEDQANSTEGGRDTNVLPAKSNTDTTG